MYEHFYWFVRICWFVCIYYIHFFKQVQLFIRQVNKNFSQKGLSLCHHQTPWILPSLLLFSSPELGKQCWERTGTDDSAGAGSRASISLMKVPMLTLARALANKPGWKGSTLTPSVLIRALILSSVTHLVVQDEGWVEAGEFGYRGDVADGLHGVMEALIPKRPWLPWKTQIHWLKKKPYTLF